MFVLITRYNAAHQNPIIVMTMITLLSILSTVINLCNIDSLSCSIHLLTDVTLTCSLPGTLSQSIDTQWGATLFA